MTTPEPIAQGDLASKPFAHLLLYLEQRGMSGTLAVWPPGGDPAQGQDRVLFAEGKPVAARWRAGGTTLEKGLVDLFARTAGPYAFYPGDLVASGSSVVQGRVDTYALLGQSVRTGSIRDDAVAAILRGYGTAKLRLKPGLNLQRFGFTGPEGAFIQVLRAAPGTVEDLARVSGNAALAKRVLYVLTLTQSLEPYEGPAQPIKTSSGVIQSPYQGTAARAQALGGTAARAQGLGAGTSARGQTLTTGAVRLPTPTAAPATRVSGQSSSGVVAAGAPSNRAFPAVSAPPPPQKFSAPPPPPAGIAPELVARWKAVADRVEQIERQNYFEMLGVQRDATAKDVSDAYLRAVKDWHPDRLPVQLGALRPWMDHVFHLITQAKDVLSNDQDRAEHLKAIQAGGGTPEADRQVASIVYAAVEFQKVEVLVRRREWDEALQILEHVKEVNPNDADYFAMEAWILHNRHPGQGAPLAKMIAAVDKALELKEGHERANFYKAVILKRTGEDAKALKFYKRALEINPRNVEAAREVRMANMRGGKGQDAGLLSKFFGKKK